MKYFIPYSLHVPMLDNEGFGHVVKGVDGFGHTVDGNQQPKYDTLFGIVNDYGVHSEMAAVIRIFRRNSQPVMWPSGSPFGTLLLKPDHSIATTFIKNNIWPDPPQDFIGYAEIEVPYAVPIYCCLGGGGFSPEHWNIFSPHVPVYCDTPNIYDQRVLIKRNRFVFPYLIPFFEDMNHHEENSYRAGLVLTNFDENNVEAVCIYTVGDVYPGAFNKYSFNLSLPARNSVVIDMYEELIKAKYPLLINSEGWLKIELNQKALVVPYMLNSNRDYNRFSAGEAFS